MPCAKSVTEPQALKTKVLDDQHSSTFVSKTLFLLSPEVFPRGCGICVEMTFWTIRMTTSGPALLIRLRREKTKQSVFDDLVEESCLKKRSVRS